MASLGFGDFLGGVNRGIDKNRANKLEKEKLALDREVIGIKRAENKRKKEELFAGSILEKFDLTVKQITEQVAEIPEAQRAQFLESLAPIFQAGREDVELGSRAMQQAGLNPGLLVGADSKFERDIRNAVLSATTPKARGAGAGIEKAAQTQAEVGRPLTEAERVRGAVGAPTTKPTPEETIAAAEQAGVDITPQRLAEAFGFSSPNEPAATEFFRALDELDAAAKSGQMDTPRARRLEQFVQKKFRDSGFFMRFNPSTGEFEAGIGAGPSQGLGSQLKPKQQLDQQAEVDRLTDTVAVIDTTIAALQEDPTAFGIVGSARGGFQSLFGVAADSIELLPSGGTLNDLLSATTQSITEALGREKTEQALGGLFDPQISQNEQIENNLAIQLASLRINLGDSSIRAIKAAFDQAKDDIKLTGFTSSADVQARLDGIRGEFSRALAARSKRLGGRASQGAQTGTVLRFDSQGKALQ